MGIPISQLPQANTSNNSDILPVVQSGETKKITKQLLFNTIISMLGSEYSVTSTYAVGDYCIYNGILYQCTTAITTPEEWDNSKWAQANLGDGIENKVTKVTGKGLSTNDYTNEDKNKVDNMPVTQNSYSTSTTNPYSANYINNILKGTTVFKPSEPTVDDTIAFSSSFASGNYIEIIYGRYRTSTGEVAIKSTGKIPYSDGMILALDEIYVISGVGNSEINSKIVKINSSGLTTEGKLNDQLRIVEIIKY